MDENQRKTIEFALKGHNLLIIGMPGSGKTFLVSRIAEMLIKEEKTVNITASTGVAALNLGKFIGIENKTFQVQTIHKYMGLKDGRYDNSELVNLLHTNEHLESTKERIINTDVLIIDEISMISMKILDQIDYVFQHLKGNKYPFGGTQVILCGDFFQLPSIPNPQYGDEGLACFKSDVINSFHHIQLTEIHRQDERDLIQLIHDVAG